jgi:tellurite methyltransferase
MGWQDLWRNPGIAREWLNRPPAPEVVEMADRLEAEGRRNVLDIGCGVGRHVLYLAARGFAVVGTDSAPTAVEQCQANLAKAGLEAVLVQVEMTEMWFEEESFDGAVSANVIHHARRATMERIIDTVTRKLSARGYFALIMPTPEHFDCGKGEEIEPGTWVDPNHREGPVPHHFCTQEEIYDLLHDYEIISLRKEDSLVERGLRSHWHVLARRH